MPDFNITTIGEASSIHDPDEAVVDISIIVTRDSIAEARLSTLQCAEALEQLIVEYSNDKEFKTWWELDESSNDIKLNGSKHEDDTCDRSEFEILPANGDGDTEQKPAKKQTDDPMRSVPLSPIASWTRSALTVSENKEQGSRRRRSSRDRHRARYSGDSEDEESAFSEEEPEPEYTGEMLYHLSFINCPFISSFTRRVEALGDEYRVTNIDWRLTMLSRAGINAALHSAAAQDALMQARNYCSGLSLKSGRTMIVPVEFKGPAKTVRVSDLGYGWPDAGRKAGHDPFYGMAMLPYTKPQVYGTSRLILNPGSITLKHCIEITFKVQTDEICMTSVDRLAKLSLM